MTSLGWSSDLKLNILDAIANIAELDKIYNLIEFVVDISKRNCEEYQESNCLYRLQCRRCAQFVNQHSPCQIFHPCGTSSVWLPMEREDIRIAPSNDVSRIAKGHESYLQHMESDPKHQAKFVVGYAHPISPWLHKSMVCTRYRGRVDWVWLLPLAGGDIWKYIYIIQHSTNDSSSSMRTHERSHNTTHR